MASSVIKKSEAVYKSSVGSWPGNELDFTIPQDNQIMYELKAMDHTGNYVNCILINRNDGIKYVNRGTRDATLTYSDGTLKVILPIAYWVYLLKRISNYH